MLIKCPECNHDISDTATTCPNCGYNIQENINEIRAKIDEQAKLDAEQKAEKANRIKDFKKFLLIIGGILLVVSIIFGAVLSIEYDKVKKYNDFDSTLIFFKKIDNTQFPYTELDDVPSRNVFNVIDQDIVHIRQRIDKKLFDFYYVKYNDYIFIYYNHKKDGEEVCGYLGRLDNSYAFYSMDQHIFATSKLAYRAYEDEDKSYPMTYSEVIDKNIYNSIIISFL